jgi:hypothetical protein
MYSYYRNNHQDMFIRFISGYTIPAAGDMLANDIWSIYLLSVCECILVHELVGMCSSQR